MSEQTPHTEYLRRARELFTSRFALLDPSVTPCTQADVKLLEEMLALRLPSAYREFLLWMGQGAGSFWHGQYAFYQDVLENRERARQTFLEVSERRQLPAQAIVFNWDIGGSFFFFVCSEGDNPPVYFYAPPGLERGVREHWSLAEIEQDHPGQHYWRYLWGSRNDGEFALRAPSFSSYLEVEIDFVAYQLEELTRMQRRLEEVEAAKHRADGAPD